MQIKFRDWLIFIFFGINLIIILFLTRFSYQQLKDSNLKKTRDQLLSINILKKRHLEYYLENKSDEIIHFIRYAESHDNDEQAIIDMLLNVSQVQGVVIDVNGQTFSSDSSFLQYTLLEMPVVSGDSISIYLDDVYHSNKTLLHFIFSREDKNVHTFLDKKGLEKVVMERSGMGATGESYLVNDQFLMQTPSRFFPDSVPETITVNTLGAKRALQDETGTDIYDDYRGVEIVGAYRKIDFHNLDLILLTEIDFSEAMEEVLKLRDYIVLLTLGLIFISFFTAIFIAKLLTKPLSALKDKSILLSKGVLPESFKDKSLIREVNEINYSINNLIKALRETVAFSQEIGRENFRSEYTPLSDKDELGKAVLEMRNKLVLLNQQKNQLEIQRKKDLVGAQESERERIARDLHDGIGPLLTTTKMKISAIELEESLKKELLELINSTISEIRSISRNLMPGVLIDFGPAAAISTMVEEINRRTGFNISFHRELSAESSNIGKEEGIAIYKIAQEAINNALKHAEAKEIKVTLTEFDEYISLFVKDNGKGFDKSIINTSEGKGLRNIQERVNIFGGDLYIESDEKGTTIEIEIPKHE